MFIRSLVALLCVGVLLGDVQASGKQPAGETDESPTPTSQVPSLRFLALKQVEKDPEALKIVAGESPDPKERVEMEATAIVKAFLESEDGIAARKIFDQNVTSAYVPEYKFSAPLGPENAKNFIDLQSCISPPVGKAIKVYLASEETPEDALFLKCLSVDSYKGTFNPGVTTRTVIFHAPLKYISPLLRLLPPKSLIIKHWAMPIFPEDLAQHPTLDILFIYNADLSRKGAMDALVASPLSARIRSLFFENSQLPANFADILKGMPCLRHLALDNVTIEGGWDTVWTSLLKTLKTLTLKNLGLPELPHLPDLPVLFLLNLRDNAFTGYPHRYMGLPMSPRWDGVYERKKMKDLPPLKGIPLIHYLFSSEPTQSPAR